MVAVFVLDRHKRCKFINAVAEFVTGVPLKQAVGRPFQELVWRGTPYAFEQSHLARALGAGQPEEGEATLSDSNDAKRPFAFRVIPLDEDDSGGLVVELMYVGGESGAARALRESERRLRLATEATGLGIWEVNAVTGQRRWSAELLQALGLPADTVPSAELFSSLLHPEDRAWVDAMYARLYEKPGDGHYAAEFRIRRANDGAERWVAATGAITYDADGKPLRGVGTLRDIHDRHMSETALRENVARLRLAVEANDIGTWDIDMIRGTQQWSPQYRTLWGLPADSPSDPELIRALVAPADWALMQEAWAGRNVAENGAGRIALEFQLHRADSGEPRWCSLAGNVFFDAGGNPVRAVGIMMDMTARRRTEERQRRLLREMHHRVNNNLAVMQAILSQTLNSRIPRADAFERIQARLMCLARVHELVGRSEWGTVPLRLLLAREVEFAGGAAERVAASGGPVDLDAASAMMLGLVFHELASNAARHGALATPDGRLDIDWRQGEDPDDPRVDITWQERGGQKARMPARDGFGFRIIKNSINGTAGARAEVAATDDGLRWQLGLPLRAAPDEVADLAGVRAAAPV